MESQSIGIGLLVALNLFLVIALIVVALLR